LTDPDKIAAWDVLLALKLDRACRDTADYLALRKWADDHGKRVVFLNNPDLDETTPSGIAMGAMTAVFAQFEYDMICERNKERSQTLIENGKWTGGQIPYGWRREGDILIPDDGGTADTLNVMADMAIAGKSNGQIRKWLNDNDHLTMVGMPWQIQGVRRVLWSDKTMIVLGDDKAAELRAALRSRSQTRGERVGGHMLLRVAFCRPNNHPLYAALKEGREYRGHYRCLHGCSGYLKMDKLEEFVEYSLLDAVGGHKLTKRVLVPGDDHQTAIHALELDVEKLSAITGTETVVEAKQAEIAALRSLPYEPDRYVRRKLDITVAEHWESLDQEGKGSFLRDWGVTLHANKQGAGVKLGYLTLDDDDEGVFPLDTL
jgi:hypothetical protein